MNDVNETLQNLLIIHHVSLDELCQHLKLDPSTVNGSSDNGRFTPLLDTLEKTNRLFELYAYLEATYPNITWQANQGGINLTADGNIRMKAGGDIVARDKITTINYGLTADEVADLVAKLKDTDKALVWDGRYPYLGLTAFQESDAQFFFGRETLVDELVERVEQATFIVIAGPSGSGKSSVARAGLFHALRSGRLERSDTWLLGTMKPKGNPLEQLAQAVSRLAKSPAAGDYIKQAGATNPLALHNQIETLLSDDPRQRCVLLVDQFEETFTQTKDEATREAFITLLTEAAQAENGRITIILSLRADFVSHCARYPHLRTLMSQQFQLVGAMEPEDLAKAITLPALAVGAEIDPALVSRIMTDMKGEPGTLPLMSFALRDLFEAEKSVKGEPMDMTLPEYIERGGIESALERHASQVFAHFTADQKDLVKNIFSKLIEVGQGRVDTRRTATFAELVPKGVKDEEIATIVSSLAQENIRLITTSTAEDEDEFSDGTTTASATVTIAHEKLIDAWPWLRQLVDDNRDNIRIQNEIAEAAARWEQSNRDHGELYRGAKLQQALEWYATNTEQITGLSARFLGASRQEVERAVREKEAQRRRELKQQRALAEEQQQRAQEAEDAAAQQTRLTRIAFGILGIAIVVAFVAAYLGYISQQREQAAIENKQEAENNLALAEANELEAENNLALAQANEQEAKNNLALAQANEQVSLSRQFAAQALNNQDANLALALQLAGQAHVITETEESSTTLYSLLMQSPNRLLGWASQEDYFAPEQFDLAFTEDNQFLIATCSVAPHNIALSTYYGSCDSSKSLVVLSKWNLRTGQLVQRHYFTEGLPELDDYYLYDGGTLSPDGRYMTLSVSSLPNSNEGFESGRLLLWDIEKQDFISNFETPYRRGIVTFSGDGSRIAKINEPFSNNTEIQIWGLDDNNLIHTSIVDFYVHYMALNDDGTRLAAVNSNENYIANWNIDTDTRLNDIPIEEAEYSLISRLTLGSNTDNSFIAYGSQGIWAENLDGTFEKPHWQSPVFDVFSFREQSPQLVILDTNQTHWIATMSNGQILRTDVQRNATLTPYPYYSVPVEISQTHGENVIRMASSPNNQLLATVNEDGSIFLWDLNHESQLPIQNPPTAEKITFLSPNGQKLLVFVDDNVTILQDLTTSFLIRLPLNTYQQPYDFNLSHDNKRMAFLANDRQLYVWSADSQQITVPELAEEQTWKEITLNRDGNVLAALNDSDIVHVWYLTNGNTYEHVQQVESDKNIAAIALNYSGQHLALGEGTSTISIDIWDMENQQFLSRNLRYRNPESNFLYSLEDLVFHPYASDSLASLACRAVIADQGSICQLLLWDTDRAEPFLPALMERYTYIPFHEDRVLGRQSAGHITFSPNGSQLWYKDPYSVLPDIRGGNLMETPTVFDAPITAWDIDPQRWLELACAATYNGKAISQEEWNQFTENIASTYPQVCE